MNNNNKVIKEDYSYDIEKIVFDDKDFYLPYNKTALFINQQRFITPYDIHDTLIHLAYGTDNPDPHAYSTHGNSLLVELNITERYCESPKLNLEISKSDCKCKLYKHKKN